MGANAAHAGAWDTIELGRLLEHVIDFRGRTPKKLGMDWGGGTIPALSANNVKMGGVNLSEPTFFGSDVLYGRWMTSGDAQQGDVLVTLEAPLGNVAQIPDCARYILSQRVVLLRFDSRTFNNAFAAHQLRSARVQRNLERWSTGTTATGIQRARLVRIPLPVPPLPEQRQIAAILDTIDDAIRKTEQIIAKLKQVKQGLLHDLLTLGIDDNGELRDPERHPEQFKESALGRIPRGWQAVALRQCLIGTPMNGIYKPASLIGRGTLLVGQTAFTAERSIDPYLARRAVVGRTEIERYGLSEGDVLVSRVFATVEGVGQPALVPQLPEAAVYESNMMRLRIDRTVIRPELLFEWLRSTGFRFVLEARVNASNQASINQLGLNSLPIGLPSAREQERIVGTLASVDRRRRDEETGLNKLSLLKAGLMEDLLTGRVRVTKLLEHAVP